MINIQGKHVYPLVTGTFGAVDCECMSLLSIASNTWKSFTACLVNLLITLLSQRVSFSHHLLIPQNIQTQGPYILMLLTLAVDEMDKALYSAEKDQPSNDGQRGILGSSHDFVGLLRQVPGMGDLATTARDLQSSSVEKDRENRTRADNNPTFDAPPNSNNVIPGTDIDPVATVKKIYPILVCVLMQLDGMAKKHRNSEIALSVVSAL